MKKLLMTMVLLPLIATAYESEKVESLTWIYSDRGDKACIEGITPQPSGPLTIPAKLGGKPVVLDDVGNWSYQWRQVGGDWTYDWNGDETWMSKVTSVVIPNTVAEIPSGAFHSYSNGDVDPATGQWVEKMGRSGWGALARVTIPDSVEVIGRCAFQGTPMMQGNAPNLLTFSEDGTWLLGLAESNYAYPISEDAQIAYNALIATTRVVRVSSAIRHVADGVFGDVTRASNNGGMRLIIEGPRPEGWENAFRYSERDTEDRVVYYQDGAEGWAHGEEWSGVKTYSCGELSDKYRSGKLKLGQPFEAEETSATDTYYGGKTVEHRMSPRSTVHLMTFKYPGRYKDGNAECYTLIPVTGASFASEIKPVVEYGSAATTRIGGAEVWTDQQVMSKFMPSLSTRAQWDKWEDHCLSYDYEYGSSTFTHYVWPKGYWESGKADPTRFWIVVHAKAMDFLNTELYSGYTTFRVGLLGTGNWTEPIRVFYELLNPYPAKLEDSFRGCTLNGVKEVCVDFEDADPDGFAMREIDLVTGARPAKMTVTLPEAGTLYLFGECWDDSDGISKNRLTISGNYIVSGSDQERELSAYEGDYKEQMANFYRYAGYQTLLRSVKVSRDTTLTFTGRKAGEMDVDVRRLQFFPDSTKAVAVEALFGSYVRYGYSDADYVQGYVKGMGVYKQGERVSLTAETGPDEEFSHWEVMCGSVPHGTDLTSSVLSFVVDGEISGTAEEHKQIVVRAVWKPKYSVMALPLRGGTATMSGSGQYFEGESVQLTAEPAEGCSFVKWMDGVTDNPRTVTVEASPAERVYYAVMNGEPPTPRVRVTANDISVRYDGQAHAAKVTIEDPVSGGTVQYRTSPTGAWTTAVPSFKDEGTYTVYYHATAPASKGMLDCDGSLTVTILPPYDFLFSQNDDGTITLTGVDGNGALPAKLVIPAVVDGKTVTALGPNLIDERDDVREVVIPDTVKTLSVDTFRDADVERVTLPHTLEAFECWDETLYENPGSWQSGFSWTPFNSNHVMSFAFSNGKAENDAGTYYIKDRMLFHRHSVGGVDRLTLLAYAGNLGNGTTPTTITVPDGVTGICAAVFEDMENAKTMSLPGSLIALGGGGGGGWVFGWMLQLETIIVRSDAGPYRIVGNSLVDARTRTLVRATKKTVIPNDGSVKRISTWAFSSDVIKSVDIPDAVEELGLCSVFDMYGCESITIGSGVRVIHGGAFASLFNGSGTIDQLVISPDNPWYEIVNGCVIRKEDQTFVSPAIPQAKYLVEDDEDGWLYWKYDCEVPYFCRKIHQQACKDDCCIQTLVLPCGMSYVSDDMYWDEGFAPFSEIEEVCIADCSSEQEMERTATFEALVDQTYNMDAFEGFTYTSLPQVAVRAKGRVMVEGYGRYAPGTPVTLTARAVDAGSSVRWRDADGKCVGTGLTYSFAMPSGDVLYSAEPISAAEGAYNWDISENGDGTVTICGVIGVKPTGILTIPPTYDGKTVTKVGVEGWDHEQGSFADLLITGLVIPEGVTELSYGAFHGCKKLTSVTLPSTLKVIRDNCFEDCSALKSIVLPEGLRRVEFDFLNRTAVSTLNLPSTLVDIEEGALAIPSGRKFTVATGNPRYRIENGYVYDYTNKVVFMRADYYQKTFVIPDGAVSISECCFGDCDSGNITIPASVRRIDYGAFCECQGLTVTFLGEEPQVWGGDIFSGATNVKVYVQPGQGWDDIVRRGTWQGVPVAYAPGAVSYRYNFNADGGIKLMRVADGMPSGSWTLPSTYDGYSVTAIGDGFPGSSKEALVTEVVIPASVKVIEDQAFDEMPKLKSVVLNEGLEEIGRDAFLNGGITSVRIPSTVGSMGSAAFGQNPLTKIEVAEGSVNYTVANGLLVDVREKKVVLSVRDQGKLVIPEGIKAIGVNAFEKVKLSSVTFPTTLERLEELAFGTGDLTAGGFSFAELDFSNTGLETVGAMAFRACSNLKTVRFPTALKSFGSWAFLGCTGLSAVYFAGAVPEVTVASQELLEWAADDLPQLLELYPAGDIYVAWSGNPLPRLKSVATYVTPEHGWESVATDDTWQGRPIKMKTAVSVSVVGSGTATDGGSYDSGAKVALRATPANDYVFAGWYGGDEPLTGIDADYRQASLNYTVPLCNVAIVARFIPAASAEATLITASVNGLALGGDPVTLTVNGPTNLALAVGSASLPVVTVTGLPSGLAFDAKALVISGKPTKPGKYAVKVSLKNTTVKAAKTMEFEIVVPNICSALVTDGIDYASDAYSYVAGTAVEPILPELAPGCTLTASGLPAGLKLAKEGNVYAITGIPTAKAGSYTVTLNITQGRTKDMATITVNVADLPTWAVGDFSGLVTFADGTHGMVSMSVSAQGKVSNGKIVAGATTWTFAANGYDALSVTWGDLQEYAIITEARSGSMTKPIELYVLADVSPVVDAGVSYAEGFFGDEGTRIELWRNVWKDADAKGILAGIAGKYTYFLADDAPLPLDLTSAGALSGKANVRARDNASVSFSTTVFASSNGVEAAFYVAPDAKNGYEEIYERFTLIPESGAREPGVAHRAPGVIAVPEHYPNDEGYGSVSVSPAGGQVDAGKTVTVSATPDSKSVFVKWVVTSNGVETACEMSKLALPMDGEHDVFASAIFRSKGSFLEPVVKVEDSERAKFAALELGVQFSAFVTVTDVENMKPVKWAATNLPTGLKINAETGEISGVATAVNAKPVVVTATSVADPQKKTTFTLDLGAADGKPAALPETAVGTFTGFVTNGADNVAAFTFTASDKGALSAKVVDASGTVSFSGSGFAWSRDGKYGVELATAKGEALTLTLDSAAGWDKDQLTGTFTAAWGTALRVTSQRNAFSKAWYFAAEGDAANGWTFAFTTDAKAAALTVKVKADGTTSVAGKLPNGVDGNDRAVTIPVSASGVANAGMMTGGALAADFAPVLTVGGKKKVLSVRTNLWFDRRNDHPDGVGGAKFVE